MNAQDVAGLVLAIAAILSPIVTLLLGRIQAKNQAEDRETKARLDRERGFASGAVDFSLAAQNMGKAYDEVIANLTEEIARMKTEAREREDNNLAKLQDIRNQLQNNQANLDHVMEANIKREKELGQKLETVTAENLRLYTDILTLQGENFKLRTDLGTAMDEIQKLRLENEELRRTIRGIRVDVEGIKQKTGELTARKEKQDGDDQSPR